MYEKLPFWTIDTVDKNCGTFAHAWPPFVAVAQRRSPHFLTNSSTNESTHYIVTKWSDVFIKWQRKVKVLAPLAFPFHTDEKLGNLPHHSWSLGWRMISMMMMFDVHAVRSGSRYAPRHLSSSRLFNLSYITICWSYRICHLFHFLTTSILWEMSGNFSSMILCRRYILFLVALPVPLTD